MRKEVKIIRKNGVFDPMLIHIDIVEIDGVEMEAFWASEQWIIETDLAFGLFAEQARKNTKLKKIYARDIRPKHDWPLYREAECQDLAFHNRRPGLDTDEDALERLSERLASVL